MTIGFLLMAIDLLSMTIVLRSSTFCQCSFTFSEFQWQLSTLNAYLFFTNGNDHWLLINVCPVNDIDVEYSHLQYKTLIFLLKTTFINKISFNLHWLHYRWQGTFISWETSHHLHLFYCHSCCCYLKYFWRKCCLIVFHWRIDTEREREREQGDKRQSERGSFVLLFSL